MNAFALNHRVAPTMSLVGFFDLAASLGITDVEIRNDLLGVAVADGTPASTIRAEAAQRHLRIVSINALYPFNVWTDALARKAATLIDCAVACKAEALVLCPLNDRADVASATERHAAATAALVALAPMLRQAGIKGLVEPLGFPESSLRFKRDALAAIDAAGAEDVFQLLHDTFHHAVAGETDVFPARTGLVHISGVVNPAVPIEQMRDADRVLVDAGDRLGTLGQIRALAAGGYAGPLSFEPFADSVSTVPDIAAVLRDSMRHLGGAMPRSSAA